MKETLSTDEWLVLDRLSREERLTDELASCTDRLLQEGMIVRAARGSFILAEDYYRFNGREETFRRLRENEVRKETLESHIRDHAIDGCPVNELARFLRDLTRDQVRGLLDELRGEDRVHLRGERRWARWYPGPQPDDGGA